MQLVQPIRDKEKIEQMKNVLRRQSYRDFFLFVMGMNVGFRISDLLVLRVKDVRGKTHISVKEKKTGKIKRFKINLNLQELIAEYTKGMKDEEYLFPSQKTRKPITRVHAYRVIHQAADQVGLTEIGTHTLRKTFGFHFYQQYKDVALLQEIYNHSSPSVTLKYIGITQDIIDATIDEFSLGLD